MRAHTREFDANSMPKLILSKTFDESSQYIYCLRRISK